MLAANAPIRIAACGAITALGDEAQTRTRLIAGERALLPTPFLGAGGGDPVPMAIHPGRAYDETVPPGWLHLLSELRTRIPGDGWGHARRPVFVTSSNFGVGSLYAYRKVDGLIGHLDCGTPFDCVGLIARTLGWGPDVTVYSHACVSAHLGLLQATRMVQAGLADEALVFTFDFLSPFVAGGFHSLKILNDTMPAPYADRPSGSIGLGDGAAFAVLTKNRGEFQIEAQSLHNEMHHFTANQADGAGFAACLDSTANAVRGRKLWLKGHGTGTLEAGRLESACLGQRFPGSPLVSWKGAIGHTLGSCGLVELAIAIDAVREGHAPGTVGTDGPVFLDEVATRPFSTKSFDAVLCASNAFGGAHASFILSHV